VLTTAAMPRYMNMIPSQLEDNIFSNCFTAVCDFNDMFSSTYCFIVMAQQTHLTTNSTHFIKKDDSLCNSEDVQRLQPNAN